MDFHDTYDNSRAIRNNERRKQFEEWLKIDYEYTLLCDYSLDEKAKEREDF